jgi:hypothetical protein
MRHDQCRNTATYNYAGQNLAMRSKSNAFYSPSEVIKGSIVSWYNEIKFAQVADINKYNSAKG